MQLNNVVCLFVQSRIYVAKCLIVCGCAWLSDRDMLHKDLGRRHHSRSQATKEYTIRSSCCLMWRMWAEGGGGEQHLGWNQIKTENFPCQDAGFLTTQHMLKQCQKHAPYILNGKHQQNNIVDNQNIPVVEGGAAHYPKKHLRMPIDGAPPYERTSVK